MSTFLKSCRRIIADMPSRLSSAGITSNDSCENCHVNFNIIRKKRACCKCLRWFCTDCISKRDQNCRSCAILGIWPAQRPQLLQLKARDIKAYLTANGVSTHGCVEKEELVELALQYLSNRQPSHSPRRMSTRLVEDDASWVLINDSAGGGSSAGTPTVIIAPTHQPPTPTVVPPPPPPEVACSSTADAHPEVSAPEVSEPPVSTPVERTEPIPVPERVSIVVDSDPSISTSLPPLSSFTLPEERAPAPYRLPSPNLSESQPNLLSQDEERPGRMGFAGHLGHLTGEPQRASSELNVGETLVSLSRTDLTVLTNTDLEQLSVKNLKVVLTSHRVDFRGCCEKAELLERARRLRGQLIAQAKIDIGELSDENLCKVCMAAPIDCVLLDCGHLVACTLCGKQMSECPVCRQYVIRVVKTFRA